MKKAIFVELSDKRYEYALSEFVKDGFVSFEIGQEHLYTDYQKIYVMPLLYNVDKNMAKILADNCFLFANTVDDDAKNILDAKNITHINILNDDLFLTKNAYITAEGAVCYIIKNTTTTLKHLPVLVLGYGRVGKSTVKLLKDNYAVVDVATDNGDERAVASIYADNLHSLDSFAAHLPQYQTIVNTVPKLILKGEMLELIDKDCFLLDLASYPGGIDFAKAKDLGLNATLALGVPGKIAPKSAGLCIKEAIIKGWNKNKL